MWDEKDWPKNSDSPTVQKALSIETLKAENAALRERLAVHNKAVGEICNIIDREGASWEGVDAIEEQLGIVIRSEQHSQENEQ